MKHYSFLFLLLFIVFISCNSKKTIEYLSITSDLEEINTDDGTFISSNSDYFLGNAKSLDNKTSHSGNNSLKLSGENKYGLFFFIDSVKADEFIQIYVWRKNENKKGLIAISAENSDLYYFQSDRIVESKDGWDLLELETFLPPKMEGHNLKIYVWNQSDEDVYFDDFKLSKYDQKQYPEFDEAETFAIEIDSLSLEKLKAVRATAFENGILESGDDDLIKMKIKYAGEDYKAYGRLKGDWLDHLYGDKWSYRVKIRKGKFWKNIRTFSIQTPASRDFLNEWVAHELFQYEDLLTTRYDFIPVSINGESKGVYAYEEHFKKQLLESKNRREGPILKLDEDFFWSVQKEMKETHKNINLPYYFASNILPFGTSKILKSKTLYGQFLNGQTLLNQYKNGEKKASEVFDVVKMAKAYAIYDLTRFYHGMAWHNWRFYYNPVLCKLELISFDGNTDKGPFDWVKEPFLGLIINNDISDAHEVFTLQAFNDSVFVRNYYKYLRKYSSEDFLTSFFKEINSDLLEKQSLIQKEFKSYKYDFEFLKINAANIRESLKNHEEKVFDIAKRGVIKCDEKVDNKFYPQMIKAFTESVDSVNKQQTISIINYLPNDILITGCTDKDGNNIDMEDVSIKSFDKKDLKIVNIKIPTDIIILKVDNEINIEIEKWKAPAELTSRNIFEANSTYKKYFTEKADNKLVYDKSNKTISELIFIPTGKIVVFEAGTEIDFVNSAAFMSNSRIIMDGALNNNITIKSSDNSALGFTVIAAEGTSELNNVVFDGFNTLNYQGWNLTGAVTFYESDVYVDNCSFINNVCEDALNIVRSDFKVNNSEFKNIYADAFDSDFCTGIVSKCKFTDVDNDAIDFSGSVVTINDCEMQKISDKAVSGGEDSKLTINNIFIDGATFGLVSKDLSILEVDKANINNCKYGILQLVKKPEYGPSTINANNAIINNCEINILIEKKCKLNLNGKKVEGEAKKLADEFYQ